MCVCNKKNPTFSAIMVLPVYHQVVKARTFFPHHQLYLPVSDGKEKIFSHYKTIGHSIPVHNLPGEIFFCLYMLSLL